MKKDKLLKYMTLFVVWLSFTLVFRTGVMAQEKESSVVGVQYRGHIQDYGWSQGWKADGDIAGTSGESKRLEAIKIKIVKTETEPILYDKAGTYGSATDTQTIAGDVTVVADGVILQNLVIQGDLNISEAVGDGNVTLNNVTVAGDTFIRGGGANSIHINGGSYQNVVMEKTSTGAVRIVATGIDGLTVVISEDATGETIILEGTFDSVAVNAPNMTITTQGDTTIIGKMTVGAEAVGSAITLNAGTTVSDMVLDAKTEVKGQGTVTKAEVKADGVSFEKAPTQQIVAPEVTVPPVVTPAVPPMTPPTPGGGGGYNPPSKIALTISDPTVTLNRVYDGSRNATVTAIGTLTGVETGDDVQVTATAVYDTKTAGTGKITPKQLTVTLNSLTTAKVYDGGPYAIANCGDIEGVLDGDIVGRDMQAVYDSKNVGDTKTITISYFINGPATDNYLAPEPETRAGGKITAKQLTVASQNLTTTKGYDSTTTAAVTDVVLGGVAAGETLMVTATANYRDSASGINKPIDVVYSIAGTNADNYIAPASMTDTTGVIQ